MLRARRKSYDEPSPLLAQPPPHKPVSAVRRTRSFDPIAEDEEVESPGNEFMKDLEKHVRETLASDNYLKPRKFGPSLPEMLRTGSGTMSPPLIKPEAVSPPIMKGQAMTFPSNYHQQPQAAQEVAGAVKSRSGRSERSERSELLAPPREANRRGSSKRGSAASVSDYGYVTVKDMPLPPEEKYGRDSIISNNCFLHRDVAVVEDDEDEPQPYILREELEKRIYLSSRRMMLYFSNQFYEIARRLGKSQLTSSARLLAPNIQCREMLEDSYKEQSWFYMPSIEIPFVPMDICFEFFFRSRPTMIHKMTKVKYQWPSPAQLDDIKRLGCNIAPVGFQHPRKNMTNPDTEIEWEIFYTKAEQYLSRSFTHPKVRVYLFCLIIFKCYFEKFDGIKEKHIRHILYR